MQIDSRRKVKIPGNQQKTIEYAAEHFISCANKAIADHGFFNVALSGGSTPKAIYELLLFQYKTAINWSLVRLFWSDERDVPPTHKDSNYKMAMDAAFSKLPIPKESIHRMELAEVNEYEALLPTFDLMMLGMGPDGHTASLFPETEALKIRDKQVVKNYIPKLDTWRITLTYPCINASENIAIYALGNGKKEAVKTALQKNAALTEVPIHAVGTKENPALWILDTEAAADLHL